jgi:hypothetical protein
MPKDVMHVPGLTAFKLVPHPEKKWDTFVKQQWRSVPISSAVRSAACRRRRTQRILAALTWMLIGMAISALICNWILSAVGVFR